MNESTLALIAAIVPSILTFIYGVLTLLKKPDVTYTDMLEQRLQDRERKLAEVVAQVAKLHEELRQLQREQTPPMPPKPPEDDPKPTP